MSNPAVQSVQVPVKLSFDGKGGFRIGDGRAGWTVYALPSEEAAIAFAREHRSSLMPNQHPCIRTALGFGW